MRLRLVPREESFFDLFESMAAKVHEGALALLALLGDFSDVEDKAAKVLDIEHEGDEITHEVMRRLNTTFVTPFDREDIHRLASNLDHVLDHIEAAAEFFQLHKIDQPLEAMTTLTQILVEGTRVTAEAMPGLRRMRDLESYWVEINRLENDGDRMFRRMVADLFSGKYKAMEVLKWKDLIEEIESAIDRLEDVANTIEGIFLKQS